MDFEKAVVRVICGENNFSSNKVLGTGFFIDKNKIVTAYHVISNYFDFGDKVYVNPINIEDKNFYEAKIITKQEESQIAILELPREFEINGLKFTTNYGIVYGSDKWLTFGHPKLKLNKGHIQKGIVSRKLNELNSYNADIDLELVGTNLLDYSGMSGSPLIVENKMIGIILEQAEGDGKVISLAAVSIEKFSDIISDEYIDNIECEKNNNINKNIKQINNIPFNKNSCFIGREDKLKELAKGLKNSNIQILKGISGVGKSQIAVMYSYRYTSEYEYIFWIRSDTDNNLINDYKEIGKEVGILDGDDEDYEKCIKVVNRWLGNNEKWLIIFDDCEEYEQIYNYIPNEYNGHIIITSKNPNWIRLIKPLDVGPFTEEESINLLLKRSNRIDETTEEENVIRNLASKLGNLPLALNQAAAYIEENSISFNEYIELYNEYQLSLFEKNYDNKDYRYTVKTVWKISLEKIQIELPISIKLIDFLSVFSNNKIPNWIIKNKLNLITELLDKEINMLNYNKSISLLKKYSLIEVDDKYLHMHCLIQNVIQNEMNESTELCSYGNIALKFICEILPNDLGSSEEWIMVSDLMHHLRYLIENIDVDERIYIKSLYKLGLCERFKLGVVQAANTVQKALELARKSYKDSDQIVLNIYNLLAGIEKDSGNMKLAKKYYYRNLEILENEDKNNYNIPILKNNIGLILLQEEEYISSKIMFEDALKIYSKDEELYVKQIGTTLSNMSIINVKLEEYNEANNNVERALLLIEKNLGVDNIIYSRALNNKGNILLNLEEYKNAKIYFEKAIKIDEDFYPENHVAVMNKKNNLAICLSKLGKEEKKHALNILNDVIENGKN